MLIPVESSSPLVVSETWPGEDQGDAFFELERDNISDKQILSPDAVTESVGGEELPIPVMDFEAALENIETTDDGTSPEQSSLVRQQCRMA